MDVPDRKWWRPWRSRREASTVPAQPAAPYATELKRGWRYTELKFAGDVVQSRMSTLLPGRLLVPYTRTMMASLLFRPQPTLIGMVGLGGGSQAKFCRRFVPGARVEAVENNADVVALRRRFRIPEDDAHLQVVLADGVDFIAAQRGRYDILLVDAYDPTGIPAVLSTQAWYDSCRDALAEDGVLAANLYCDDPGRHVEKLRRSFGARHVLVLKEPRMSNRVVFAWRGRPLPAGVVDPVALVARVPSRVRRALAPELLRVAQALRQPR